MATKAETTTVKIKGWEKYNPRKDVKRPSWFRLDHGLFDDPEFYDFTHGELCAWIYILCQASRKNAGTITLNQAHFERIGRLPLDVLNSALRKLEQLGVVTVTPSRLRHADGTPLPATYERTDITGRDETNAYGEPADVTSLFPTPPDGGSAKKRKESPPTNPVWESYSTAMLERHGEAPRRDRQVNALLSALVRNLGDEAPPVAAFYVSHSDPFYVRARHPLTLLVRDYQKLRIEWLTGNRMTTLEAKSSEKRDSMREQAKRVLEGKV